MSAAALPAAAAGRLRVLWRFSRPHTMIGTAISILGIYAIATAELPGVALGDGLDRLALTLLAGAAVNVYIVGLNQLEDVEVDRVNKPSLPLAAGELSVGAGRAIVAAAGALGLVLALTQGWVEVVAVGSAMAVGTAYSSPPLRLRRWPVPAAASIAAVRSVAVNVGVYLHLASVLGGREGWSALPESIVALTLFVLVYALAIAVLKDVPDAEGDRSFRIATFTVLLGPRRALALGMAAITVAYLGMALAGPLALDRVNVPLLAGGHLAALAAAWAWARAVDLSSGESITRFYMRVWLLFFLEYALVPAAVLAG
jgi:homogentisate phytyltransferase / homogentisate geranylgeranyltransferase